MLKDWKGLFRSSKNLGKLKIFEPFQKDGKVIVKSAAVERGISKWRSSLVGQFIYKPLPYFLVKKNVKILLYRYGSVEEFSVENGLFIFKFEDEDSSNALLKENLWHI